MGKRILIFDDDFAILDVLQELLDYEGFETSIAERTDDVFNLVRFYRPELILMDFSLYGLNGGEWCTKLKSNLEFSFIPVIIFTAYTNKGIGKGTFGCDDFIAKPFDIDDLVIRIKSLTEVKPSASLPKEQTERGIKVAQNYGSR